MRLTSAAVSDTVSQGKYSSPWQVVRGDVLRAFLIHDSLRQLEDAPFGRLRMR